MPDPVELTFVSEDVTGGTWLEWGHSFRNVTDMVDQAISRANGACIKKLIIVSHGSTGSTGFIGFDNNTTGTEFIDAAAARQPYNATVRQQFERLKAHLCPDATIEFRVCEFGTGANGQKACQFVADWTGANVTAPCSTIKSIMVFGGLATDWVTVYPSSTLIPPVVSFWKDRPRPSGPPVEPGADIAPVTGQYVPLPNVPPPTSLTPPATLPTPPPSRTPLAAAGVAAAGVVLAGGLFVANAGQPGATASPAPTVASASTVASPTATRVLAPPRADHIIAVFHQPTFTTSYSIVVEDPDGVGPTVRWSGPNCGTWTPQQEAPMTARSQTFSMRWSHPHPPCAPTTDHRDVQVTFTIAWTKGTLICVYEGSESGNGPSCKPL